MIPSLNSLTTTLKPREFHGQAYPQEIKIYAIWGYPEVIFMEIEDNRKTQNQMLMCLFFTSSQSFTSSSTDVPHVHTKLNNCYCQQWQFDFLLEDWRPPPPTPKSVPPQTPQLVISDTQHLPSYAAVATMKYRRTRDKLRRRELKESESGQDFFSPSVLLQGLRWLSVLPVACPSPLGASSVANIQHFVVTAKRNTLKKQQQQKQNKNTDFTKECIKSRDHARVLGGKH